MKQNPLRGDVKISDVTMCLFRFLFLSFDRYKSYSSVRIRIIINFSQFFLLMTKYKNNAKGGLIKYWDIVDIISYCSNTIIYKAHAMDNERYFSVILLIKRKRIRCSYFFIPCNNSYDEKKRGKQTSRSIKRISCLIA